MTKFPKKLIGIILAVCMLVSLFTCLSGLTASAASTKMIVWNNAPAYSRLLYRPSTPKFASSTKYMLSFDLELTNTEDEAYFWRVFYCNTSSSFTRIAHADLDITKTALTNGYHYDVVFTTPGDVRPASDGGNILLKFGDTGSNGYVHTMKLANLDLWSLDSGNNKVDQLVINVPSSIDEIEQVTEANQKNNGVNGKWVCPSGYKTNITVEEQSDYFDPTGGSGEQPEPESNTKLFYINGNQTNLKIEFRTSSALFKYEAGEQYVFTCRAKSNAPQYIKRGKLIHFNYYNNNSSVASISPSTDPTFTESYDSKTYVYTATFTVPDNCRSYTNAYFTFGDRNGNLSYYKAYFTDFEITKVSTSEKTAFPFVNTDNVYDSGLAANDKYRIPSGQESKITVGDIGSTFAPVTAEYVHFEPVRSNYSRWLYRASYTTCPAGNYRFTMDCKIFSGTPTVNIGSADNGGNTFAYTEAFKNYMATYDAENYKYVITFTFDEAFSGSDRIGVLLGNYGTTGDFVCANPELYLLDGDGNPASGNFINTFASNYYSSSAAGEKWERKGNYTTKTLPDHYFDTEDTNNFAAHFAAGKNNYQVLAYKDNCVYVNANSVYRLVLDVNNLSAVSVEPTVQLRTGSDIGTSYNGTLISTNGFERIYEFTVTSAATGIGLFIGNYGKGTDLEFALRNPRLYTYKNGTYGTTDILVPFSENNYEQRDWKGSRANATSGKWTPLNCDGNIYQCGDDYDVYFPDGFLNGTAQKNMYYISEVTTAYQGLEYYSHLEAGTTYYLEFDWRTYAGAYPKVNVSCWNDGASDYSGAAQTARSNNTMDGAYTAITDNLLPAAVVNKSYGHYAVSFTTPANLSASEYQNVKLRFANYITDDNYAHYGRGAMYLGNFSLKKSNESVNIIKNGGLEIAKTGRVTSADTGKFAGFSVNIEKSNGSRDLYKDLCVIPQPENFFTEDGAAAQKLVKFNGGDYDYIRQDFLLEPATQYVLYYNYTYVNAAGGNYIQNRVSGGLVGVSPNRTFYDDDRNVKYVVFTTDSGLLTDADMNVTKANVYISMLIGRNAPDAGFCFADVQLRKWSGTEPTGPNLINNGGFIFGDEAKADSGTAITGLASASKDARDTGAIQLTGWYIYGYFNANRNIEVINFTDNFFAGHKRLELRLPLLRKMLLGLQARENSPYEDINGDLDFNVKDYARTKLLWIESETGSATTVAANNFKSYYVNGDNATDLDEMDISLFGNKTRPTTVYYVDADNGNDSNNGTSPSTAWKTLNKVNSTSLSSGSAVLFKCGQVWRAKTGECTSTDTNKGALRCQNGVTYGSYGSGAKPIICGSYYNYASRTWTSAGTNIWKTNINLSGNYHGNDVGIIVYNYGSLIGKMTLKKADLANEGDFWCREPNGTDGGDGNVYVYCTENPADHWRSIEIGQKRNICDLANNCTVNNICFKYGGLHGLTGSGLTAVCISNCEIAYIGGAYNTSRLGNGVELALTAANCRVKNCYVRECYDAGLTFQCWTGTGSFQSINFSNNLIENCNYSIEYFVNNASDKMQDIYIMNNICRGAGYGWSYDEREGYSQNEGDIGCFRTAHIRCTASGDLRYTNLSEFYIQNNIFDCSKGALIYWWWNASDSASPFDYDGLHISGNTLYQAANSDDRIIQFRDESAIYGSSTYSVREALKKFEGTDTPAHLNDSKYVLPERVISNY